MYIKKIGVLLFNDFETLDVFGPVEIMGRLNDYYRISFYSESGELVKNSQGVSIDTQKLEKIADGLDVFLIPGGMGTRKEVNNKTLINIIKQIAKSSTFVLTVCTGSALLAKTGLLDNRVATSNKIAFDWVISNGKKVKWIRKARWTIDDKFYTSSGISAGMDMTLGFIRDIHGLEFAKNVAIQIEYNWQEDKDIDNFCNQ
ncbi:MAG: dimethyladenosine transferase [Bacteroidetes bacterium]|nr:dimethyladenosine transferase [Bacteroidota bacterium]